MKRILSRASVFFANKRYITDTLKKEQITVGQNSITDEFLDEECRFSWRIFCENITEEQLEAIGKAIDNTNPWNFEKYE